MRLGLRMLLLAVVALLCPQLPAPAAAQDAPAAVVLMPDDTQTRGDWLGTYGSHAYLLCGMRSPESLTGGPGFADLGLEARTGKPDEPVRAWLSVMPSERDRTILLEPSALRRTPASFDDHGEVYPAGTGPDLHMSLSVPEGIYLLSLYFFEIDWIQYRAYDIEIYSPPDVAEPVLQTSVTDFHRGKYKRFAVTGPCELRLVIRRGQSPNAIFSGLFVDSLTVPDLYLFDRTAEALPARRDVRGLDEAVAEAREALDALGATGEPERYRSNYLAAERDVFLAAGALAASDPAEYGRRLAGTWAGMRERLDTAAGLLGAAAPGLDLRMMRYHAERAACDFGACRDTIGEVAEDLLSAGSLEDGGWDWRSRYLREYAVAMLDEGRRAEARPLLEAYVLYCLEHKPAGEARELLTEMGRIALTAKAALPVAEGLNAWEERYGELPTSDRLLAGGLYYAAGRNREAYRLLSAVEPHVAPEVRHRWCLVAMASALLRMDREEDAENVLSRLQAAYPGAAEADELRYRFGVYYFRRRRLEEARQAFESLRDGATQQAYAQLCDEYLVRVEHLRRITETRERADES